MIDEEFDKFLEQNELEETERISKLKKTDSVSESHEEDDDDDSGRID